MESSETARIFTFTLLIADIVCGSGRHTAAQAFFISEEDLACHGGADACLRKAAAGNIRIEPLVLRANAGEEISLRFTPPPTAQSEKPSLLPDAPAQSTCAGFFDDFIRFTDENGCLLTPAKTGTADVRIWHFPALKHPGVIFFQGRLPADHGCPDAFGALLIEEAGTSFHDIRTGAPLHCGTKAVIRKADKSAFREYVLFVHDILPPLVRNIQQTDGPQKADRAATDDTPYYKGINYHTEPIPGRLKTHGDPAYAFSSRVHGDPATPILEAYPGDMVVIHIFDPTRKNLPAFRLFGMTCHTAPSAVPGFCEVRISRTGAPGDYLYIPGKTDDAWTGLWGVFRVHAKIKKRLLPLQNKSRRAFFSPQKPENDAVVRRYEIAAIPKTRPGFPGTDWLFVHGRDTKRALRSGYRPKPLLLRAEAGDWIEITLRSLPVSPEGPADAMISAPDAVFSRRISLHPECLSCDPVFSSGINVGYNKMEQTIPPGGQITYLWHADSPCSRAALFSFGDIRLPAARNPAAEIRIRPQAAGWIRRIRRHGSSAKSRIDGILKPFICRMKSGLKKKKRKTKIKNTCGGSL